MSVLESKKIDFFVINKESEGELVITDHLDWSDEGEHLMALQEKVNSYIAYIEGGQMHEDFPESQGKPLVIMVYGVFELVPIAIDFYKKVEEVIKPLGAQMRFKVQNFNEQV